MSWLRDVDRWLCAEVLPNQHAFQALARRLTGSADVARDVVQDVYAEVLRGEGWRRANDPKAFVMRIVYCRSIDWLKRQRIVSIHALPDYEDNAFADQAPDAFERLSGREELLAVLEALQTLPVRCRQVVTMRRIEDLPPKEIAKQLDINLATVERHLARGLAMLAERLAERGGGWRPRRSSSRRSIVVSGE